MGEKFCDDCLVHLESDLYTKDGGARSRPEVTGGTFNHTAQLGQLTTTV